MAERHECGALIPTIPSGCGVQLFYLEVWCERLLKGEADDRWVAGWGNDDSIVFRSTLLYRLVVSSSSSTLLPVGSLELFSEDP